MRLKKNPCYGIPTASQSEIESWGRRYNPATGEMDGDWKNCGWRGIIDIGDGDIMTEVGLSDEFDGVEIGYPLIVPDTTDAELLLIAQAQRTGDDSVIPQSAYDKAVAWAIQRIEEEKSPFYNGDASDETYRNIESKNYYYELENITDRNRDKFVGWFEKPILATPIGGILRLIYGLYEREMAEFPNIYTGTQRDFCEYLCRTLYGEHWYSQTQFNEIVLDKLLYELEIGGIWGDVIEEYDDTFYDNFDTALNRVCTYFCNSNHVRYTGIDDVYSELGIQKLSPNIKPFKTMLDANWIQNRALAINHLRYLYVDFKNVFSGYFIIDNVVDSYYSIWKALGDTTDVSFSTLLSNAISDIPNSTKKWKNLLRFDGNFILKSYNSIGYNHYKDMFYYNDGSDWINEYSLSEMAQLGLEDMEFIVYDQTEENTPSGGGRWEPRTLDDTSAYELAGYGTSIPQGTTGYFFRTDEELLYYCNGYDEPYKYNAVDSIFYITENGVKRYARYMESSYINKVVYGGDTTTCRKFQFMSFVYLYSRYKYENGSFSSISYYYTYDENSHKIIPSSGSSSYPSIASMYMTPRYIYGTYVQDGDTYEDGSWNIQYITNIDPTGATGGECYYNPNNNKIYQYDSDTSTWSAVCTFTTVTDVEYYCQHTNRGVITTGGYVGYLFSLVAGKRNMTTKITTDYSQSESDYPAVIWSARVEYREAPTINGRYPHLRFAIDEWIDEVEEAPECCLLVETRNISIMIDGVSSQVPTSSEQNGTRIYVNTPVQVSTYVYYKSIYLRVSGTWVEEERIEDNFDTLLFKESGEENNRIEIDISGVSDYVYIYGIDQTTYPNTYPTTVNAFGLTYINRAGTETSISVQPSASPTVIEMYFNHNTETFYDVDTDNLDISAAYKDLSNYTPFSQRYEWQNFPSGYHDTYRFVPFYTGISMKAIGMIIDLTGYFMTIIR